jgi:hypothetical protein
MKITPAMIEAARGADPALADLSDQVIRAVLKAALNAAPGAKPTPDLIATIVHSPATQRSVAIPHTVVRAMRPKRRH